MTNSQRSDWCPWWVSKWTGMIGHLRGPGKILVGDRKIWTFWWCYWGNGLIMSRENCSHVRDLPCPWLLRPLKLDENRPPVIYKSYYSCSTVRHMGTYYRHNSTWRKSNLVQTELTNRRRWCIQYLSSMNRTQNKKSPLFLYRNGLILLHHA